MQNHFLLLPLHTAASNRHVILCLSKLHVSFYRTCCLHYRPKMWAIICTAYLHTVYMYLALISKCRFAVCHVPFPFGGRSKSPAAAAVCKCSCTCTSLSLPLGVCVSRDGQKTLCCCYGYPLKYPTTDHGGELRVKRLFRRETETAFNFVK